MNYSRRNQPIIRLVPLQPYTNSRLMVYCSTIDKIPINFHATWWRVNPQTGYRQEIKNHQGSCYQCSPFDYKYYIQVNLYYEQLPGMKILKIAMFPAIKLNRQLLQRQIYVMEPILCKLQIDDTMLDVQILITSQYLMAKYHGMQLDLPLSDVSIQMKHSCLNFTVHLENKFSDLIVFISNIVGRVPQPKIKGFDLLFCSRIDRDFLIFSMITDHQRNSTTSSIKSGSSQQTPRKQIILNNSSVKTKRDKGDTSLSLGKKKQGKIKISQRVLKKYTQNTHSVKNCRDQQIKKLQQDFKPIQKPNTTTAIQLQSMDLRDSFAQFQQNTSMRQNQQQNNYQKNNQKKNNNVIQLLAQQNYTLKKQLQNMNILAKENVMLKKKYHQLSQQISRLEIQRRQILQDKLKYQANYFRQCQQKQYLKKQIQSLKQMIGNNTNFNKRQYNISPFTKYDRPITPQRHVRPQTRFGPKITPFQ